MTHTVCATMTKKMFTQKVLGDPDRLWIDDPSIINPSGGTPWQIIVKEKGEFFVTNHPKRSWFARVFTKEIVKNGARITVLAVE